MDALDVRRRGRGRPAGSGKPASELRQRRDYRFLPSTLRQIEYGRQLTETSETAFVEAAVAHYARFLEGAMETPEVEQLRSRVRDLEEKLAEAQAVAAEPKAADVAQWEPVAPAPTQPVPSSSARLPTYQIYLKHEPGSHPRLPEGEFAYIDLPTSIEPRQCPIHRVFVRSCAIAVARLRVEQLKHEVSGITHLWLEKNGETLAKDSWHKERGRWVRND